MPVQTESSPAPFFFRLFRGLAWQTLTIVFLVVTVAGAGLTGCSIEGSRKKKLLERIQPPQPVIGGTAVYGGGVLSVESWLGSSVRLKKTDEKAGAGDVRGHRGQRQPGSASAVGISREHSTDAFDQAAAEGDSRERREQRQLETAAAESNSLERFDAPFEQGSNEYSPQEVDEMYGRSNYEFVQPPRLALTFKFTNTGATPITFKIVDVNSPLGNFAPRPETLTVAPGQAGSVDPMLSNTDSNFEELEVTLTVKIGGKEESQVLKLRRAPESAAAPKSK
jgi:hypothetical protein